MVRSILLKIHFHFKLDPLAVLRYEMQQILCVKLKKLRNEMEKKKLLN